MITVFLNKFINKNFFLEIMDPIIILKKYYDEDSYTYKVLIEHSKAVANKALEIAKRVPEFNPDLNFIYEFAMLHDIGIYLTHAPDIGCYGDKEYICHGYLGRDILLKENLEKHALACERHLGVGFSKKDIEILKFPLEKKDIFPITIEEEIVCFADKFFSKNQKNLSEQKSIEKIRKGLSTYGMDKVKKFDHWLIKFKEK